MRRFRVVAVLAGGCLLLGSAPAQATDVPPPPSVLWAFTSQSETDASASYEMTVDTGAVTPATSTSSEGFLINSPANQLQLRLRAPGGAGAQFIPGPIVVSGSSSFPTGSPLWLSGRPSGCTAWTVQVDVRDVVRSADSTLTGLAFDYQLNCLYFDKTTQARLFGAVRYGTTSASYGVPRVDPTYVAPTPLPADRSEVVDLPVSAFGDATIQSVALSGFTSGVALTADDCGGAEVDSSTACHLSLTVDTHGGTSDARAVIDVALSDGTVVRLARTIAVRPALEASAPMPYPVVGGMAVAVPTGTYGDTVEVLRRSAPADPWTALGEVIDQAPQDGSVLHLLDPTAAPGVRYDYSLRRTTADRRFSTDYSAPVAASRPAADADPTDRTRIALRARSLPTTTGPDVADSSTGLTTIVNRDAPGVTSVLLTSADPALPAGFSASLIPGPGSYTGTLVGRVTVGEVCTSGAGTALLVRDVLYDEDGTLRLLDASVRGCQNTDDEIRFRAGGDAAIPVITPVAPAYVADPGTDSPPTTLTLTNTGPDPVTVGPSSLTGPDAAQWSADDCSATSLPAGGTCTLGTTFHAAAQPATATATLAVEVSASGAPDPASIPLAGRTTDVPGVPQQTFADALPFRVIVGWGPPTDDGGRPVTSYVVERSPVASLSWQEVATVPAAASGLQLWTDDAPLDEAAQYRVSAVSSRGAGAPSQTAGVRTFQQPVVAAGSSDERARGDAWSLWLAPVTQPFGVLLDGGGYEHESPTVSPDGRTVVFSRARTPGAGQSDYDLWSISLVPGSTAVQLTDTAGGDEYDAEVSPDGTRVAFTYQPVGASLPQVWVLPLAGGAATEVAAGFSHPSWVSQTVVLAEDDRSAGAPLARLTVATGSSTPLAGTGGGRQPTASPDGSSIAFVDRDGSAATLAVSSGALSVTAPPVGDIWSLPQWLDATTTAWSTSVYGSTWGATLVNSREGLYWSEVTRVPPPDATAPVVAGPVQRYLKPGASAVFTATDAGSPKGGVRLLCSVDGHGPTPCTTSLPTNGLSAGVHGVVVTGTDASGNVSTPLNTSIVIDGTAPSPAAVAIPSWTRSTSATFTVGGTDNQLLQTIQYRERLWPEWQTAPNGWSASVSVKPGTRASVSTPTGSRVCVQARGVDGAGNVGAWGSERCISSPVDDRSFFGVDPGWKRATGTAFYRGTATYAKRYGTRLASYSGVGADRLAVIATTCPTCGSFRLYHQDRYIGSVSLARSTTTSAAVIMLPAYPWQYGQIEIRTTSSRLVRIDAVIPLR